MGGICAGVDCRKAALPEHPTKCLPDLWEEVRGLDPVSQWDDVLQWEGRMEELVDNLPDHEIAVSHEIVVLRKFVRAHMSGVHASEHFISSESDARAHAICVVRLEQRRLSILNKMERFQEKAEVLCNIAHYLHAFLREGEEAAGYFQRAHDLGLAHGFSSVKCEANLGLAHVAMEEGKHEEAVELFEALLQ